MLPAPQALVLDLLVQVVRLEQTFDGLYCTLKAVFYKNILCWVVGGRFLGMGFQSEPQVRYLK